MDNSINVVTAAQRVLQQQMVVIANNIANSNTVGYRAENVEFHTLVSRSGGEQVNFPTVSSLHQSGENGSLQNTGNPLDIAMTGNGWFAISTPSGTAYTRDGRMQINAFGELQTIEGHALLDASNAPLLIPTNSGPPEIHSDGRVEVNGNLVGNIGVFEVNEKDMQSRFGNSSFFASTPGIPVGIGANTKIQQGFLEGSNVNAMREMANLITVSRSFESAASMIEGADRAISKSINELADA